MFYSIWITRIPYCLRINRGRHINISTDMNKIKPAKIEKKTNKQLFPFIIFRNNTKICLTTIICMLFYTNRRILTFTRRQTKPRVKKINVNITENVNEMNRKKTERKRTLALHISVARAIVVMLCSCNRLNSKILEM